MKRLLDYLVLPPTVSAFERSYLRRMNTIALWFFVAHIPFLAVVGWLNGTGALAAALAAAGGVAGPLLATKALRSCRQQSMVFGVTAMLMGALLVHFGRGMWTIEMHFYFFVALALLAVFANPMVVLVGAVTVAVHHFALWFISPQSVFNYDAPLSSVLVHAAFVVVESVAAVFVARSFFDNVIGLERIVEARTAELDARNREMSLVFEHVNQGLLTATPDGVLNTERSRAVDTWFGAPQPQDTLWSFFGRVDPRFSGWLQMGWDQVIDGLMPREVALDMLPKRLAAGERLFDAAWQVVERDGKLEQVLLMVSDVTERVRREEADLVQRELMEVFDKLSRGRTGFLEFFGEARAMVDSLRGEPRASDIEQRRVVHTLKGNCALFGFTSVARACHDVESLADEGSRPLTAEDRAMVIHAWEAAAARASRFLDEQRPLIELEERDIEELASAIDHGAPKPELRGLIESWRNEPLRKRFERLGEQAQSLAQRLNKGAVRIETEGQDLRLPRERFAKVFSVLPHVVRNAVDHGLPSQSSGKDPWLRFSCVKNVDELVLSVADNGTGIDWDAVAAKARQRGLEPRSRTDLVEALFLDGLSTRNQATDVSGRGVGMSAVREACEALGGRVEVDSAPGGGTRVSLHIPLERHAS